MIQVQVRPEEEVGENFFCFYGKPKDIGKRYRPGDKFSIHDASAFSDKYMICLDEDYYVSEDGKLVEKEAPKKRGPKPKQDVAYVTE